MFNKKCPSCDDKIKNNFDFCPSCGHNLKSKHDNQDFGFLGKNDFEDSYNPFENTFIDKVFNGALKMLERQMKSLNQDLANQRQPRFNPTRLPNNLNVQFFVNGKKILPERQGIQNHQNPQNNQQQIQTKPQQLSQEKLKKLAKLPRKEPESKLTRLSGKLVCELSVPGVTDIEDILINQLENSIEIKAISDKQVYHKTLNLSLPIERYQLYNDNLIVQFGDR